MEALLGQWICYHQTVTETNVMHICMPDHGTQITNSKFTSPKTTLISNTRDGENKNNIDVPDIEICTVGY